jgi:kynurenine formamidase
MLIDLSQTVRDGLVTYPGLPAAHVCDFMTREASRAKYAAGTEFHIGKIEMVSNTGTYVDAPFHRWADGRDISQLPLEAVADLPGLVVRSAARAIDADAFAGLNFRGHAVLVCTGWSRHFGTPQYGDGSPFLTEAAAKLLRDGGAALVGIDALNIDDTRGNTRPVHSTLLRADVLVCEHLTNLEQVPVSGFRFYAVPVKVKGLGTFPVRAFAQLEKK